MSSETITKTDLMNILNEVLPPQQDTSKPIKFVSYTGTMPTVGSNQYWSITFSGTAPAGYTPIGIISVNTGTSNAGISGFYLDGNGIPIVYGRTFGTQSTTASANAIVLFVKTSIL